MQASTSFSTLQKIIFAIIAIVFCFSASRPVFATTYGSSLYGNSQYGGTGSSGNSSGGGGGGNAGGGGSSTCTAAAPRSAPNLYQIDRQAYKATLFFAPAASPVDHYLIVYGYTQGDDRFNASFVQGHSSGAIKYVITDLSPKSQYVFKVRGENGCTSGNWSNSIVTRAVRGTGKMTSYAGLVATVTQWAVTTVQRYFPQKKTTTQLVTGIPPQAVVTKTKATTPLQTVVSVAPSKSQTVSQIKAKPTGFFDWLFGFFH